MKLIIYFSGTGNNPFTFVMDGEGFSEKENPLMQDAAVLFIHGCDHRDVCNSVVAPDLAKFAKRFVRKAFEKKDGKLAVKGLTELEKSKIGVMTTEEDITYDSDSKKLKKRSVDDLTEDQQKWLKKAKDIEQLAKKINDGSKEKLKEETEIDEIILCGYSRGAVTCFNVAKELDKVAPNIPVTIIANQPVPGSLHAGPGTGAGSVVDCSKLKNLRDVRIILGSYTGKPDDPKKDSRFMRWMHRAFYSQVVPKLPHSRKVKRKTMIIPRESHHQRDQADILIQAELYQLMNPGKKLPKKIQDAINEKDFQRYAYPKQKKLQRIFGVSKKDAYLPLLFNPVRQVIEDLVENPQTMVPSDIWKRFSRVKSRSSKETKKLDKAFNTFGESYHLKDDWQKLIKAMDIWLDAKRGGKSARYELVINLRARVKEIMNSNYPETAAKKRS